MEKLRTDPIALACSALGILSFALTWVTSEEVVFALGVAGVIYIVATALACFRFANRQKTTLRSFGGWFVGTACALFALETVVSGRLFPWWTTRYGDLHSFGLAQMFGILGLALLVLLIQVELEARHRKRFQVCPDCLEECRKGAHVCRYCGFRWT